MPVILSPSPPACLLRASRQSRSRHEELPVLFAWSLEMPLWSRRGYHYRQTARMPSHL